MRKFALVLIAFSTAVWLASPAGAAAGGRRLLAATSLALPRSFWWSVAVGGASALATTVRPDLAIPIYSGSGVLVSATLLLLGYRMIK